MKKLILLIPIFILSCEETKRENYLFQVETKFKDGKIDTLKFEGDSYYLTTNENIIDAGNLVVNNSIRYYSIASGVKSLNLISKDSIK